MKNAIVTFAAHQERHILGEARLKKSLEQINFDGDYFSFTSEKEISSPLHSDVPYAFKPYSIETVIDKGYKKILWIDSAIYATQSLDGIFEQIDKSGVMLFKNIGYSIADHTTDICLNIFGISREEAQTIPMIMACCMGFDMSNEIAQEFFYDWIYYTKVKGAYEGGRDDHRHDQSVASIIAHQQEIPLLIGHETFFTYKDNQGMMPVADSVCLYSQGF